MTDPLQTPNSPLRKLLDLLPFVDPPRYDQPIALTPESETQIQQQVTAAIGNDRWPPEGQRTPDQQQAWTSWNERRDLLTDAYTQAETTGDVGLRRDADQLATQYHDQEVLRLSRSLGADDAVPAGWHRASDDELAAFGIDDQDLHPDGSGFDAEVFVPDPDVFGADAPPVMVFEGTDFADVQDVNADVAQAMGDNEQYYNRAMDLATRINSATGGNVEFSGHSLGGGEATAAALVTGAPAVVSNPAGVHPATTERFLSERGLTEPDSPDITTYVVDGDMLTELQATTADLSAQNADGLAAVINGVGQGMNAWYGDTVLPTDMTGDDVLNLPDASGRVVTLDARNADGSDRPDIVPLEDIVGDINERVEDMPLDDFAGYVENGTDWLHGATDFLNGVTDAAGNVLDTAGDWLPDGGLLGGLADVVTGGGDAIGTVGDWVEEGGDITLDVAEGIETVASVAVEAADGDVRDSVSEMVDRHSFTASACSTARCRRRSATAKPRCGISWAEYGRIENDGHDGGPSRAQPRFRAR
jgi:hypothetical protein